MSQFDVPSRQQYTISSPTPTLSNVGLAQVRPSFGLPGMERIVRPFVTIDSSPPAPPKPKRTIPGESDAASICIGGPSRFETPQLTQPYSTTQNYSVTASFPSDNDNDDRTDTARVYREVARTVEVVRVENPSDAEQYVDVERIETIDFVGPDGVLSRFILDHT